MEAVQILNCSREGLPGVWGAERIDGDGGNGEALPGPVTRFDHRTDRIVKVVVNR